MLYEMRTGLIAATALLFAGCATQGAWMGAEAEKSYDKELEIKRLSAVLNNDDYFELEKDGRLYVISDAKDYAEFVKSGELVFSTKKIGGGPGGKTIVYGLVKKETELLAKDPRAQGAAQKMYEGNLKGLDKDFFGVVLSNNTYYVFSSWKDLAAYKATGSAAGYTEKKAGPESRDVVYVAASSKPADLAGKFAKANGAK